MGKPFGAELYFNDDALAFVQLWYLPVARSGNWSDSSEDEELAYKAAQDELLQQLFGLPESSTPQSGNTYSFSWGKVSSYYDPRGGFSSITVRYGNRS
ncbi:MAG: hypothetical protein ABI551_07525 [Polyangiaceae bacterium]